VTKFGTANVTGTAPFTAASGDQAFAHPIDGYKLGAVLTVSHDPTRNTVNSGLQRVQSSSTITSSATVGSALSGQRDVANSVSRILCKLPHPHLHPQIRRQPQHRFYLVALSPV
jgi:hypothetical protein